VLKGQVFFACAINDLASLDHAVVVDVKASQGIGRSGYADHI